MPAYVPRREQLLDPTTGEVSRAWKEFFDDLQQVSTTFPWLDINFTGSSLAHLQTRSASDLNTGTLPLGRLANIADAQIAAAAAIAWSKISKSGALLSDLGGTLPQASKWSEATTSATGNQDNVNFSSADYLRCANASTLTIRGLAAGVGGQHLTIAAIGAGAVELAHQDTNSTAGNRIITPTGSTVTVTAGTGMALLVYDAATTRWRVVYSS